MSKGVLCIVGLLAFARFDVVSGQAWGDCIVANRPQHKIDNCVMFAEVVNALDYANWPAGDMCGGFSGDPCGNAFQSGCTNSGMQLNCVKRSNKNYLEGIAIVGDFGNVIKSYPDDSAVTTALGNVLGKSVSQIDLTTATQLSVQATCVPACAAADCKFTTAGFGPGVNLTYYDSGSGHFDQGFDSCASPIGNTPPPSTLAPSVPRETTAPSPGVTTSPTGSPSMHMPTGSPATRSPSRSPTTSGGVEGTQTPSSAAPLAVSAWTTGFAGLLALRSIL